MECEGCKTALAGEEDTYEHLGHKLCEDCYMDALDPAKACDPWAVHTARSFRDQSGSYDLSGQQERIMSLIEARGRVKPSEVAAELGISESELSRDAAALRHMELLRGSREQGELYYRRFDDRPDLEEERSGESGPGCKTSRGIKGTP